MFVLDVAGQGIGTSPPPDRKPSMPQEEGVGGGLGVSPIGGVGSHVRMDGVGSRWCGGKGAAKQSKLIG
eukprot:scaffold112998_cov15-Tisochrysis_lutea.AAC.1